MPNINKSVTTYSKFPTLMPLSLAVTFLGALVYFSARLAQLQTTWGTGNEGMAFVALLALFVTLLGITGLTISLNGLLRAIHTHIASNQD
jgi:hypothetical protein